VDNSLLDVIVVSLEKMEVVFKLNWVGCGEDLMVEVPEEYVRISHKHCPNCNSLVEVVWVNEEEY